jgi:hypothetical protein
VDRSPLHHHCHHCVDPHQTPRGPATPLGIPEVLTLECSPSCHTLPSPPPSSPPKGQTHPAGFDLRVIPCMPAIDVAEAEFSCALVAMVGGTRPSISAASIDCHLNLFYPCLVGGHCLNHPRYVVHCLRGLSPLTEPHRYVALPGRGMGGASGLHPHGGGLCHARAEPPIHQASTAPVPACV